MVTLLCHEKQFVFILWFSARFEIQVTLIDLLNFRKNLLMNFIKISGRIFQK